ncbi:MAG: hypothetical protein ACI906_002671 [Candidatus Latescibacterota bacterium]|jgi:hypothetical protein
MPIYLEPAVPVAFVCALTVDGESIYQRALSELAARFGPIGGESDCYSIDVAGYYAQEMGVGLSKKIVYFEDLIDPAALAQCKLDAMDIERNLARSSGSQLLRRVNIDPGLLSIESLVLATSKRAGHRICIAPSLYAETTLLYQKGEYRPLPWTYLDYQSELVQHFLLERRRWLKALRKNV